jgi:hypothetical protein
MSAETLTLLQQWEAAEGIRPTGASAAVGEVESDEPECDPAEVERAKQEWRAADLADRPGARGPRHASQIQADASAMAAASQHYRQVHGESRSASDAPYQLAAERALARMRPRKRVLRPARGRRQRSSRPLASRLAGRGPPKDEEPPPVGHVRLPVKRFGRVRLYLDAYGIRRSRAWSEIEAQLERQRRDLL